MSTNEFRPTLAVARNSQTIYVTNLLKYVVHGRGATKPPAPVSPHTTSLKPTIAFVL